MKKRRLTVLWVAVLGITAISAAPVKSTTPEDTLKQYVSDLRKNPADYSLREKIVRLAQEMKPAPAIPEEARRHYVKGRTLLKDAKSPDEARDAAEEFKNALLVAPWYPDANRYCGIALGIANRHDEAIAMLKLYIATNPSDARDAQDEIYALEARKDKAGKESGRETITAREQKKPDDWLRKVEGRRFRYTGTMAPGARAWLDVRDATLILQIQDPQGGTVQERVKILGRETTVPVTTHPSFLAIWAVSKTYVIDESGDRITQRTRFSDGDTRDYIWLLE